MESLLFLLFGILTILPGLLVLLGAVRFKKHVRQPATILILMGTVFILIHLLVHAGTYYHSFLGTPTSLADYSLTKSWVSPVAEYIGLVLIAAGLLIFKKK